MLVTMNMEEYKVLESKEQKLFEIRRLARVILAEHSGQRDWSKCDSMEESMTLEESKLLLQMILEH